MVQLTYKDRLWLQDEYPRLIFIEEINWIIGWFDFSAQYVGKKLITDSYKVEINLNCPYLPRVVETEGKIKRMATILGVSYFDMHLNLNGSLCLIHPTKITKWYRCGITFIKFMDNLRTHLYWVSYRYRNNRSPWEADPHNITGLPLKEDDNYGK